MARPAFVICDTDALIQLLLTRKVTPLRLLRDRYKIQPLIMPEVDIELRSNKRFGARISHDLKKALTGDLLQVLNKSTLERYFASPLAKSLAADAAISEINKLGNEFQKYVDVGEAFTHAAALTLEVPAMSNDRNALDVLLHGGMSVPATVLRSFDLIALSYQVGDMSEADCEVFRKILLREREQIPGCFQKQSFTDGLQGFCPRIRDSGRASVGEDGSSSLPYANILEL